ncbi:hypothetical protein [Pseudomonas sp. IT-P218]|uniref:hypothetical protein n=1 Tax=Pseudomonas sp. IT-P218 TaxID=3026449 RepID=UPI0039E14844
MRSLLEIGLLSAAAPKKLPSADLYGLAKYFTEKKSLQQADLIEVFLDFGNAEG